jgi:hypothetical protein
VPHYTSYYNVLIEQNDVKKLYNIFSQNNYKKCGAGYAASIL